MKQRAFIAVTMRSTCEIRHTRLRRRQKHLPEHSPIAIRRARVQRANVCQRASESERGRRRRHRNRRRFGAPSFKRRKFLRKRRDSGSGGRVCDIGTSAIYLDLVVQGETNGFVRHGKAHNLQALIDRHHCTDTFCCPGLIRLSPTERCVHWNLLT